MDSILNDFVKTRINNLKDIKFQDFINELFSIYYGNDFTIVKQKHDKGSDGIIKNDTVIACYAPEKIDLEDFKKKINNDKQGKEGDFQKYKLNWEDTHAKWIVVINGEWLANMIQYVHNLKPDTGRIGQKNLLNMIDEMDWTKQQKIFQYLGIGEEYITTSHIEQVIQDLIKRVDNQDEVSISELVKGFSTNLSQKIELNYDLQDLEIAKLEFETYLQVSYTIEQTLADFGQLAALKLKVQKDYFKLNDNFSFRERKDLMKEEYAGKRKNDETYCHYVDMFLLYIFEQCLIGKKLDKK